MGNFSQNLNKLKYSIITLLLLMIPIGYYFYEYVPSREDYFTSRNLRLLGEMSEHINEKVKNYKTSLDNVLIKNQLIKTVLNNSRINPVAQDEMQLMKRRKVRKAVEDQLHGIENFSLQEYRIQPGFSLLDSVFDDLCVPANATDVQSLSYHRQFSHTRFSLEPSANGANLHLKYLGQRKDPANAWGGTFTVFLNGTIGLQELIAPLIQPEIFDNILVLNRSNDNTVVYQAVKREFLATRLDTLFEAAAIGKHDSWREITLGNTRYKMYSQPIRISYLGDLPELNSTPSIDWELVGLVEAEKFEAASREISHFRITLFIYLVFVVLISLPFIKLRYIGEREELKKNDLLLGLFAILLGAGGLTFFLLTLFAESKDVGILNHSLKKFASEIEENFHREIDQALLQVDHFKENFSWQGDETRKTSVLFDPDYRMTAAEKLPYPFFNQIAWIAGNGEQARKVGTRETLTPLVNVAQREYFQRIKNRQYWYRSGGKPFFIQPIISITTGENNAVISLPDSVRADVLKSVDPGLDDLPDKAVVPTVVALSLNFSSLQNTLFPQGFGYCIIDENGKVLFHSDADKNLQENFFTECDNNEQLRGAVFSRVESEVYVDYIGRGHRIFVRPLPDMPWTLITFADVALLRTPELSLLSIAVLLFLFLLSAYALVLALSKSINIFNDRNWFWPQKGLDKTYRLYIPFMFGVAGFCYAAFFHLNNGETFYLGILLPLITVTVTHFLFREKMDFSRLKHYMNEYRRAFPAVLGILLISGIWLHYQAVAYAAVFALFGAILASDQITKLANKEKFPIHYIRYAMSGVAFLVMISILPVVAFFKVAYDAEMELLIKRSQIHLLQDYHERQQRLIVELQQLKPAENSDPRNECRLNILESRRLDYQNADDIYARFFFQSYIGSIDSLSTVADGPLRQRFKEFSISNGDTIIWQPESASPVDSLLAFFRSRLKIAHHETLALFHNQTADSAWQWQVAANQLLLFRKNSPPYEGVPVIVSQLKFFNKPTGWIWFLGLPMLVIMIFLMLMFFVQKVFIHDIAIPNYPDGDEMTMLALLQNTLYIGQPNSGKSAFIQRIHYKYVIDIRKMESPADLMDALRNVIETPCWQNPKTVIILDHFDHHLGQAEWDNAKLTLLESLISTHQRNLVLVTAIDPEIFFTRRSLDDQVIQSENKRESERWAIALSSFTKAYHNIRANSRIFHEFIKDASEAAVYSREDENEKTRIAQLYQTVADECAHTLFLQNLGTQLVLNVDFRNEFFNPEVLVDEILQRAESYYKSIWAVLGIEEKIVLYHLARNGFAPPKDARVVRILTRKGLLHKELRFRLLNESFRKYVLTAEPGGVIEKWRESSERGWQDIRTPLVTVLIALALFLFVTQRTTFDEGIAWLSAITAVVPVLMKLVNVFRLPSRGKTAQE